MGWVSKRICSIPNCGKPHKGKGYCDTHLQRLRKIGQVYSDTPISRSEMRMKERNPRWKGGTFILRDGHGVSRMAIQCTGHPYPNHGKDYVYRYRLVMEKYLGRYLLPTEIVHHKNGDTLDDRLENLEITNHEDHMRGHMADRERNDKGQIVSKRKEKP